MATNTKRLTKKDATKRALLAARALRRWADEIEAAAWTSRPQEAVTDAIRSWVFGVAWRALLPISEASDELQRRRARRAA